MHVCVAAFPVVGVSVTLICTQQNKKVNEHVNKNSSRLLKRKCTNANLVGNVNKSIR